MHCNRERRVCTGIMQVVRQEVMGSLTGDEFWKESLAFIDIGLIEMIIMNIYHERIVVNDLWNSWSKFVTPDLMIS